MEDYAERKQKGRKVSMCLKSGVCRRRSVGATEASLFSQAAGTFQQREKTHRAKAALAARHKHTSKTDIL